MTDTFSIGTTLVGLQTLASLGIVAPSPEYSDFSTALPAGDGTVKGGGWPIASWFWSSMYKAQRDILKGYCSGLSAVVFIRTRLNDGTYAEYEAVMIYPPEEDVQATRSIALEVKFQRLVLQP